MSELLRLIRNEVMKIKARPGTWMMVGALVFMGIVFTILWSPEDLTNLWLLIGDQLRLVFFVNTFVIIVAANIIANEYSSGTIKFLLIRPVSRSKILRSKLLTVLIFGLFLLTLFWVYSTVIYGIATIFKIIGYLPGKVALPQKTAWSASLSGVLLLYGLRYIEVIVYGTIALTLSVLSKRNALSMGITWTALVFGPEVTRLIADGGWGRLMLFANLNLTQFLNHTGIQRRFWIAIVVILLHLIILYFLSWIVFTKRDVME
jgi:ABC-2 type transport system permease protein